MDRGLHDGISRLLNRKAGSQIRGCYCRLLPSYKKYHKKTTQTSLNFLMTRESSDAGQDIVQPDFERDRSRNGPSVRVRGARENDRVVVPRMGVGLGSIGFGSVIWFGIPFTSKRNQVGSRFKVSVLPDSPSPLRDRHGLGRCCPLFRNSFRSSCCKPYI